MTCSVRHACDQAAELHRGGHTPEAAALLGRALARHGQTATPQQLAGLRMLRAVCRHSLGQWQAALADAETAMLLMPLPVGGQLVLADCYCRVGRTELALLAYSHLLSRGPLPSTVYAALYTGLRRCGRSDLALQACRAAARQEPDNHAAYYGIAHCMAALGYAAVHIARVLRQAVALRPESAVYRASLAVQLLRDGKPDAAHQTIQHVEPPELGKIGCLCSARMLARLCTWANDRTRAEVLVRVCHRLGHPAQRDPAQRDPAQRRPRPGPWSEDA